MTDCCSCFSSRNGNNMINAVEVNGEKIIFQEFISLQKNQLNQLIEVKSVKKEMKKVQNQVIPNVGLKQRRQKVYANNFSQIKNDLARTNKKFEDPDFPPNNNSIGYFKQPRDIKGWRRVGQVYKNINFIVKNIQPQDITQGDVGDCYFLSVVAALAAKPNQIERLLGQIEINPNGIYMVRLLYYGTLMEIFVDDYFPFKSKNQPTFAKPTISQGQVQIWAMVLEKCWAKLHHSYSNINGGYTYESLRSLSCAPTFIYTLKSQKQKKQTSWQLIRKNVNQNAVICAYTINQSNESVRRSGIVNGHAYSVVGLYEKPQRLIKLRNPWGRQEYNGIASDKDLKFWDNVPWSVKNTLGYVEKDDGDFFMRFDDFVSEFAGIDVALVKPNPHYNFTISLAASNSPIMHQITVKQSTSIAITISHQPRASTESLRSTMILALKTTESSPQNQYVYFKSDSSSAFQDHNMLFRNNVPAGKYILYVEIYFNHKAKRYITTSIYSQSECNIQVNQTIKASNFLSKVFLNHSLNSPQNAQKGHSIWLHQYYFFDTCRFGYVVIHASDQNLVATFSIKDFQSNKMAIVSQGINQTTTNFFVQIKSHSYFILVYRFTPIESSAISFKPFFKVTKSR